MQASILTCYGHVTFGILNEVWFIKLHDATFVFAFLICSILNFKNFGEFEGSVAQTIVEDKELSQRWLG